MVAQWLHAFHITKVLAVGHREEPGALMQQTTSGDYLYRMEEKGNITDWILDETDGQGVDIAIDCAGSQITVENCLNCVRPGGQVLVVGNPKGDMAFSKEVYWKILRKQIHLTGTWNSTFDHSDEDDWNKTLRYMSDKRLQPEQLITHKLSFEELPQGLKLMQRHTEYYNKVMVQMDIDIKLS